MARRSQSAPLAESRFHQNWSAYALLGPALLILFLTLMLPATLTLGMSVTDVSFLRPTNFVGLKNYIDLFQDSDFHQAVFNTTYYTLGVTFPVMALGLLSAVAVNRVFPGRVLFRTIFYLPVLTSLVAAATVWLYIYEPYAGLLNGVFLALGLPAQPWLQNPDLAMPALIIMAIWRDFGTAMIIYLAGLQDIPSDIYEAARMDGARSPQIFFRITIPMLSSVSFYLMIILIVQSFQIFGAIYIMTGGGPLGATTTLVYQMYKTAFAYADFGYSAAISTVVFLIILTFSILGTRLTRRKDA